MRSLIRRAITGVVLGFLMLMPPERLVVAADWYVPTTAQALDPRIPRLDVAHPTGKNTRGTAVLIAKNATHAWYITNHHMTPYGAKAKYVLVTPTGRIQAKFIKHHQGLDLGLLYAAPPAADVMPLKIAAHTPSPGTPVGIHGWTHGRTFGYQEGPMRETGNGWTRIGVGANQGQSGGAFISDGYIVGITSRTNTYWTRGASVYGIRRFMNWD